MQTARPRKRSRQQPKSRTSANTPAASSNDADTESPSRNSPGRSRRSVSRPLNKTQIRKIIHREGFHSQLTNVVYRRINGELKTQNRFLSNKSLFIAALLRSRSIFSRELALRQWKTAYAEIYRAKLYQRKVNRALVPALKSRKGQEDIPAFLEQIQTDCRGGFRDAWQGMPRYSKATIWQPLAIWLLQNDPKLALEFLFVTTETLESPDFTMVADCFLYLDNFYYADWLQNWKNDIHTYPSLLEKCLRPGTWPIVSLPNKGARLYIRRSRPPGVSHAFRMVKERNIGLCPETALCFMWRFTELGDVDRAFQALEFIPKLNDPHFSINSTEVFRHCCKLLTLDTVHDSPNGRNFQILPRLLEMGVQPDRDMMNIVVSNAFRTGDPQLGFDMLQFMKNHGHEFDSYTYVTLLTDAVARGDRGRADSLIREIELQEDLRSNEYLVSKIFHSHFVFTAKYQDVDTDSSALFYSMLGLYNQLHDITPLRELLIIPPHYTPKEEGTNSQPSLIALFIMIATYLRCHKGLSNVQRVYGRFHELVRQGHPSIAPLAATDHTYNEFLIALRDNPRGLRTSVRIVEDMLRPPTSQAKQVFTPSKPTIRTWTLLLSAFNYSRQPQAVDKIKEMMAKHHVSYSDVTWNIIVNGYANAQDIPRTAVSIKAMEQEGFSIDSYTMKSLRYLRDPDRLWVAIDELDTKPPQAEPQEAAIDPGPELTADCGAPAHEDLVDRGLKRLRSKLKSKL
ncbi:uncharacterized protein N7459_003640 [Penicillium hispanicum]|uniref:uncharacterized protein n=1 Tax=Penicillium hispanicum TaxID=1080232 RepID=UPI0025419103|nr:uncharacterized protein N7459_003640 [Penicillium hispanicum]KAJ5587875.1 hypothetical protein N7459_003640 [Penicillium hispanicum]